MQQTQKFQISMRIKKFVATKEIKKLEFKSRFLTVCIVILLVRESGTHPDKD
jgi:hypothetical protein